MTHEMVKRVAAAIAEPKERYIVKYYVANPLSINIDDNEWQVWFIGKEVEKLIASFANKSYDNPHGKAEDLCELMNNDLLARLAIEAMKKLNDDIVKFLIENYGFHKAEFWAGIWEGAIDNILKE